MKIVSSCLCVLATAVLAAAPPPGATVRFHQTDAMSLPVIADAAVDWTTIPVLATFGDRDYPTELQLCADRDNVYLRAVLKGKNGALRGESSPRDADLAADDALTLYFDPGAAALNSYRFTVNCRNAVADAESWNTVVDLPIRSRTGETADGWLAEVTIPLDWLEADAGQGFFRFNAERQVSSGNVTPLVVAWGDTPPVTLPDAYVKTYRLNGAHLNLWSNDAMLPLFVGPATPAATLAFQAPDGILTVSGSEGRHGTLLVNSANGREQFPLDFHDGQASVKLPLERLPDTFNCLAVVRNAAGQPAIAAGRGVRAALPYDRPIGNLLAATETVQFWTAPAGYKIMDYDLPGPAGDGTLRWSCAGNEYEGVSLVVRPLQSRDYTVSVSEFTGPDGHRLPVDAVTPFAVEKVMVVTPVDAFGHSGYWPDPLAPLADGEQLHCPARGNKTLYLRSHVPAGTPEGVYQGTVTLADGSRTTVIPAELTVYDFTLPRRTSMRTAYAPWNHFEYFMGATEPAEQEKLYRLMIETMAEYRLSPGLFFRYDPVDVDEAGNCDFTAFDRQADYVFGQLGLGDFNVGYHWTTPAFPFNTPISELTAERHIYRQLIEHLKAKGYLDYAFFYQTDEPGEIIFDWVKRQLDTYHELAPEIKRLLTVTTAPENLQPLIGSVDIWVPILSQYQPEFYRQRQQAGDEVWWYVCMFPRYPYPANNIDSPGILPRIRFWMAEKYQISGSLYWAADYLGPDGAAGGVRNPWDNGGTYAWNGAIFSNGDGMLFYPPCRVIQDKPLLARPLPSLRAEAIRDGLEDREYFVLLAAEIDRLAAIPEAAELTEKLKDAQQAPDQLIDSLTEFDYTPEHLLAQRDRIARLIGEAHHQFPPTGESR